MAIPLYTRPRLRSPQDPSPFEKGERRRPLRIFLDQPLTTGPIDGQAEFLSYPFAGNGSTGYPAPEAVLRSLLAHPAFEVRFVADQPDLPGAVTFPDVAAPPGDDIYPFQERRANGVWDTWFAGYRETVTEMTQMIGKHRIAEHDARAGVLLHRAGIVLEADLIVTAREWLLSECGPRRLESVVSPEEAVAMMGLFLRWHELPIIIGGAAICWNPSSIRRSAAFTAMPAFERWNQAGRAWHDVTGDLTLENLNQTCLTRIARAFKFRDGIYGLSATMAEDDPEEMLCEFDSLLFSLVGAFDAAARAVDHILGLGTRADRCGWQKTGRDGWQRQLEEPARDLHNCTRDGSSVQRLFEVLRLMRNTVHYDALGLVQDNRAYLVTLPGDVKERIRALLRAGHPGWDVQTTGVRVTPPGGATASKWLPGTGRRSVTARRAGAPPPVDPLDGELAIDVRTFTGKVFPASLAALNEIMRLTPLEQVPGYSPALDMPSRVNLPWNFSDTTGHRLRMLFGITELDHPLRREQR